jgi:hypothetical protein
MTEPQQRWWWFTKHTIIAFGWRFTNRTIIAFGLLLCGGGRPAALSA